ncbi:MAG TPA: DivIVA domain-containing protein, partial [candidate division Zixibacteria bacterium]|nr:DivIVA domain-containing protein [candidate division Zixibacteria bacterium]
MSTALSPNDIRNYEFPNQMRGYDKDEVRELLQQVAAALEDLKQENLKIAIERDTVRTQLEALKQFEDTIKSAAIDARRNADTLVANAKREVGEILNKARAEAETIVGSRADEARVLDEQITRLRMVKVSYQTKLKNLIESHLELIDELQRVKEPEVPRMQPARPTAAAEPSADDTAKTPTITSIPATPAASETEPARAAGDFRRDLRTATTAPEADWIRQAREANIPAVVPPTLRPFKPTNGLEVEE